MSKHSKVTVRYEATIGDWAPYPAPPENELSGYIDVPSEMWDRRPPGRRWSDEIATLIGASINDKRIGSDADTILHFRNIDPADTYCEHHRQYKPCEVCDPAGWRKHFGL